MKTQTTGETRALRNNNPGNLRGWNKNLPKDKDGFDQFPDLKSGFKALENQIKKDSLPERNHTLETFVKKYAPAFENNVESYINFIINNTKNLKSNLEINAKTNLKTLVDAIGYTELAKIIAKQEDIKVYKKLEENNFYQ